MGFSKGPSSWVRTVSEGLLLVYGLRFGIRFWLSTFSASCEIV